MRIDDERKARWAEKARGEGVSLTHWLGQLADMACMTKEEVEKVLVVLEGESLEGRPKKKPKSRVKVVPIVAEDRIERAGRKYGNDRCDRCKSHGLGSCRH